MHDLVEIVGLLTLVGLALAASVAAWVAALTLVVAIAIWMFGSDSKDPGMRSAGRQFTIRALVPAITLTVAAGAAWALVVHHC